MITITPYGAAGEVTGSAYLVETPSSTVLVDFGMFQGDKDDDARNVIPGRIHRMDVDAMVLTHAHLDHCGRLPLLVREGYRGPIFCTPAARDLAEIILLDAAHIMESDFDRRRRRSEQRGRKMSRYDQPLYDKDDVTQTLDLMEETDYGALRRITKDCHVLFHDAGHMLGSASIELRIEEEDGTERVIVFSGDIGPPNLPYLRDPEPPAKADVVFLESTYGDRDHKTLDETVEEFERILVEAVSSQGKVFIPAFAIGRAQQMMFHIAELIRKQRIPAVPIYLDSPMAIKAVNVYRMHRELFDAESTALTENGQMMHDLRSLVLCTSAQESKMINQAQGPFIVIAGSGMCTAGRIMHHLRNSIDDSRAHFIIAGYQARGSLGRHLVDGATQVSVMGERKLVKARIHTLGGFSAHAGQTDLVAWFKHVATNGTPLTFLTHGEQEARTALKDKLSELLNVNAYMPAYSEHLVI
ncbi:MAG: MBL fold metallo-hydrolase [Candidatus Kapabacteria bacterium]|nr:MBL fold metallo-hydrolase [Candidatus Kapabacteria bacterium]